MSCISILLALAVAATHGIGCSTDDGPDATTGDSGSASMGDTTGPTSSGSEPATTGPAPACSLWSDWDCTPFSGACSATCDADASLSILCDPGGVCIFRTGPVSNKSCADGQSLSEERGCESCKAAVEAGCY